MSVRSEGSYGSSYHTSSNDVVQTPSEYSHSRLSSNSSTANSVHRDSWSRDFRGSAQTDSMGKLSTNFSGTVTSSNTAKDYFPSPTSEHPKRKRLVTKEQMLAYRTYVNDINYTKGQSEYLTNRGSRSPQEDRTADYLQVTPNIVPGYTLTSQLSSPSSTSLFFYATDDSNDASYIIRLSPNFVESVPVARFLNEWYLTSCSNPPLHHRPWCNHLAANKYVPLGRFNLLSDESRENLRTPITLPKGLPGVLYPLEVFNVHSNSDDVHQRRIGFVYPNYDYKTIKEFHADKPIEKTNSDNSSLNCSIRSMISEMSIGEKSSNRNITRNLGTGVFDDLANRVSQQPKDRISIISILTDMISVATTLAVCHELGIVHNAITSNSILRAANLPGHLDPKEHTVVLTGWDFAFSICVEDSTSSYRKSNIADIPDFLPYMSPENSGETTCLVDYRTDFYSAGIVLYELIVGCQPFQSDNPVRIRKMHISQRAIPPSILGQGWISEDLNDIIMKCLEKDPADRYNNAHALISDLKEVRNDYLRLHNMERGEDDSELPLIYDNVELHKDRNAIPLLHSTIAKLKETPWREQVFKAFKEKHEGIHFIVMKGDTGVGKSTLLQELKNVAVSNYNFCISWSYNCADINVTPYKSGISAIQSIVRQILASSKENIAEWRHKFTSEIDTDLSILYSAIPELKILLGPRYQSIRNYRPAQSESDSLLDVGTETDTSERVSDDSNPRLGNLPGFDQHSLNIEMKLKYIIKRVWSLVGPNGVTLILDDIQWANLEEVFFLKEVSSFCTLNEDPLNIKVVCGYRTGEPSSQRDEPIIHYDDLIQSLDLPSCKLSEFALEAPSEAHYAEFIGDNNFGPGRSLPTEEGNFVTTLYKATDGIFLRYNYLMRTLHLRAPDSGINLDIMQDVLNTKQFPLPMADIVDDYLNIAITEDSRELLKFAAIIASNGFFSFADLMIVTAKSMSEVSALLSECLESRVLVPSGIFYKIPFHLISKEDFPFDFSDSMIWEMATKAKYHFDHDAIQVHLLTELEIAGKWHNYHRVSGLRYQKKLSSDVNVDITSNLVVAYHLLLSEPNASDKDSDSYYETFITGGRYALATSNLPLALRFFSYSTRFIAPNDRRSQLRNLLTICQVHFHIGNFSECASLIQQAEEKYGSDSNSFLYLKVKCLFHMKHFRKGMRTILKGLESLGVEVSGDPQKCEEIADKFINQAPLSVADIRAMKDLRPSNNQRFKFIVDLISDAITPTYILGMSHLRMALLSQLIRLMNTHGVTANCAIPLIHLANYFVQPNVRNNTAKAIELCDVALSFVNNFGDQVSSLPTKFMRLKFSEGFNTQDASLMKPSGSCMTVFVTASNFLLSFLTNSTHPSTFKQSMTFANDDDNMISQGALGLWTEDISYKSYKEKYTKLTAQQRPDLEFVYLANAVIWLTSEGRYKEAAEIVLDRCYHVSRRLPISIFHLEFYFYAGVSLCLGADSMPGTASLALAAKILRMFDLWSDVCPPNFETKLAILTACYSCTQKNRSSLTILDNFEVAIDAANKATRWIEACLANYLCARWLVKTSESKKRITYYAQNALSIAATLKADRQVTRLQNEFSSAFDSFNWAGVSVFSDGPQANQRLPHSLNDQLQHIFAESKYRGNAPPPLPRQESNASVNGNQEPNLMLRGSTNDLPTQSELTKAIKLCLTISESSDIDSIVTSLLESAILFSNVDYGAIVLNLNSTEPIIKAIGTLNNLYKFDDEPLGFRTDLVPYSVIVHSLLMGEAINKDENPALFDSKFGSDHYYLHNPCSSALCIPIKSSTVLGAIYLERHALPNEVPQSAPHFHSRKIDLIDLLCSQAAVSFSKSLVYSQMELAKKAAEDATAEKASFLANMSHEIRTPFNSLFACSLFLLDTSLTDAQREYVETIKSSALVTLSIIDGILAFSKIEHGSFNLDCAPFDLNSCVESAIQVTSEQTSNENLEIVFYNNCPNIVEVLGDSTRVRQIIINLVGNAVKFTMEGYIKISLESKHISENRYDLKLTVEDTGIGIPANSKSKVFGAFSQVDGSSRRVHGGSGLGLAISKKLVDIMNGSIHFESVEGAGTTFYFTCPFEVSKIEEHIDIKRQKVALVAGDCLRRDAFSKQLTYLNADLSSFNKAEDFNESPLGYDIVFVHDSYLSQLSKSIEKLKGTATHIHLITEFGTPVSHLNLQELGISSILFAPMRRSRVEEILRGSYQEPGQVKPKQQGTGSTPILGETYPLRILLAEDNAINLRVASQHLKKLGYVADHAKDGVEVLEKCDAMLESGGKYDVIFMDIQMPRKDGITATIELKETFIIGGHVNSLPEIVALTANVAGEDRDKCLNCGMTDFISKPILPEELRRVLTRIGMQKKALQ
ncbi:hypothetical protein CXQ85_000269 [Candidozyma haemuli]|uniref:histidine kinase n=1 Tax=Candidozyma haemuli TaxID=45357 RepID=A0A2V1ASX0_9ASCO|nr:hypothetical protein CXQ85_000269 [[Candida] haemuloni]PVH21297.1 hypothetical protein CXQ85_000269 [[Candida] haemuloni]